MLSLTTRFIALPFVAGLLVAATTAGLAADPQPNSVKTSAGPLVIHPIQHATFVMQWNGKTIYVDPVGGGKLFERFPEPDVVLVTDIHGDHYNAETLAMVVPKSGKALIVAPKAVVEKYPSGHLPGKTRTLANGQKTEPLAGVRIRIEAVPMYNLTPERQRFHTKGRGNGYVVSLGDVRVYISGDTEDVPEMRKLKQIDVAFVCMNLPYTMDVEHAASAVLDFKPKIVFPFHYRGGGGKFSDVKKFKMLVGDESGVEVRQLNWYK